MKKNKIAAALAALLAAQLFTGCGTNSSGIKQVEGLQPTTQPLSLEQIQHHR